MLINSKVTHWIDTVANADPEDAWDIIPEALNDWLSEMTKLSSMLDFLQRQIRAVANTSNQMENPNDLD